MQIYKRCLFIVFIILFLSVESFATEAEKNQIEKADLEQQISYAIGYDIFENLTKSFKVDPKFFSMGAEDSYNGKLKITQEKLKELVDSFQRVARQKQIELISKEANLNKEKGLKFLEKNKTKKGVISLPSGLQYQVLEDGTGPMPKASDTVECHYKGTLIDGTVFDSSYRRGQSATFQVGGVIKGWIEALQLMKTGSKWLLYIPSDLAYGDRGAGEVIKPGAALIFEVELLSIVK
jgi:FKBP-type peptidyl-prolyl cis-trans isomerase